jgi:hypothetical protein
MLAESNSEAPMPRCLVVVWVGLCLLAAAVPVRSDESPVAVIELAVTVEDDQLLFSDAAYGDAAPVVVEDGRLWLGPDAARAIRWSRPQANVALEGDFGGYADLGSALLVDLQRSGPTHASRSWRAVLGADMVASPSATLPDRMVLDMTRSAPDLDAPVLWPADWSWSLDGETLTVEHDGDRTALAPGERLDLGVISATLPVVLIAPAPVPKGEDPVAFPEIVEEDMGTTEIVTSVTILWHGLLPVEIVE